MKQKPQKSFRFVSDARLWTEHRLARYRTNLALASLARELRVTLAISQREVAERMRVSTCTVGCWERGLSRIPEYRLKQYQRVVTALGERNARKAAA